MLRLSYFLNTLLKSGIAFLIIRKSANAKNGTNATYTVDSCGHILNAIIIAKMNIIGERTAMRIIIIYAICTLEISVVRRVTRLEVENLSIFVNEKP